MKKQKYITFLIIAIFTLINIVISITNTDVLYAVKAENTSKPRILLKKYEIVDGRLVPGATVKMRLTFKNESVTASAKNLLITYSAVDNDIHPVFGDANQLYIDEIPANGTKTVEVNLEVADDITMLSTTSNNSEETSNSGEAASKNVKLSMNIKYQIPSGGEDSNNLDIVLPVTQECVLDIKNVSLAENVKLGSDSLVSLVCANTGISNVYNVVMQISGDIPENQKTSKIGNILTGAQEAIDYYITLQKEGKQSVKIKFTYEDEDGNEFSTQEKEYTVYVENTVTEVPDNINNAQAMNEDNKETALIHGQNISIWTICLVGAGVIAIILIIAFIEHMRKHRK